MERFLNKVFCGDARQLLRVIPTASIDACITDAMYGTRKHCRYEWGLERAKGNPDRHWHYHEPIYEECLRILRPGGVLAWGQSINFCDRYQEWFGDHEQWRLFRRARRNQRVSPQLWIVQTKERQPVPFPKNGVILFDKLPNGHPFPKPVEEMAFLIQALTNPGEIVLDCCCGLGSTLIAAEQLHRRWVGCDLGRTYCRIALKRLAKVRRSSGELTY